MPRCSSGGPKGERLKSIARDLGLSESRISQVRTVAIERLRERFAFRPLD